MHQELVLWVHFSNSKILQDNLFRTSLKLIFGTGKLAKIVPIDFWWNFLLLLLFICSQLSLRSVQNDLSKQIIYPCGGLTEVKLCHSLHTSLLSAANAPVSLTINHLGFCSSVVYSWLPCWSRGPWQN